ncbi:MAG: SWIM zinc finger family protein [Rhodospirillales bacterium]|jgi:uncharacterized Zn finger protein|nr:SWIM zinc finger family protein [Rhodospirillales bacterium]
MGYRSSSRYDRYGFAPYVPVAEKRQRAMEAAKKLTKKENRTLAPIHITGRAIATTFWGNAWCENLERYSDFENRLPRGRTYVRNGSVIDLRIEKGKIHALVSGSDIYTVTIAIKPLPASAWQTLKKACAGQIASLLELLQGKLSGGVLKIITDPKNGLFPKPVEISLDCSCPDWANLCKHVAATLYGVGALLDHQPELFFLLRGVDQRELIADAGKAVAIADTAVAADTLEADAIADVFGIGIDVPTAALPVTSTKKTPPVAPRRALATVKTAKAKPGRTGAAKTTPAKRGSKLATAKATNAAKAKRKPQATAKDGTPTAKATRTASRRPR